ncbi:transcription initiation factor IIF, beta subunit-domain-containing protein [Amylostereum chailletii]|nr:transcription initiation factor IIF, beta subunit-domain-containing protein [Amylostereum chailletii]
MDVAIEDEKKPFDLGGPEEDQQPDPQEHIMLDTGTGRVWLVKVPRFLMERWSAINAENVELARIRIYDDHKTHQPPRIFVQVPSDPANPQAGLDLYELDMQNQEVENQIVVAEREKEPGTGSRARTTIMTGKVRHECNLRPTFSDRYRERIKEATRKSLPRKSVRLMDDVQTGAAGKMLMNRLSSGVTTAAGFSDLNKSKSKPVKGQFERMARMPRNQLLDMLFGLYRERDNWPIKLLRERTQQPEAYLKEVLAEIATLHRSGEFNGMWELKPEFKGDGVKGEAGTMLYAAQPSGSGAGGDNAMEEEEEDEDEDMEEVS